MTLRPKLIYFLAFLSLITFLSVQLVDSASEYKANTTMNASVSFFISITPSSALLDGIQFSTVNPGTNNNLAMNDSTGDSVLNSTHSTTDYYLTVDTSTNYNVDFFNKDDDDFMNATTSLGFKIENVTIEANISATGNNVNYTKIMEPNDIKLTSSWVEIGGSSASPCDNVAIGSSCYMVYLLDIPTGILAGNYQTKYCYCAVEKDAGSGNCGCT